VVFLTGTRSARALPLLRLLALLPISLYVGHEAVFGAQYGFGESFGQAMSAGGHDGYWSAFGVVIMAVTGGLLVREGLRMARLRRRMWNATPAAGWNDRAVPAGAARTWRAEFRSIWPLLFAATAVAFSIQENLEHLAAGQTLHGLGALVGSEHPLAVPVLALVTAAVAAAGALIRWRVRVLEFQVSRAARASLRRHHLGATAPAPEWPVVGALRAHAWFLIRLLAGRAPPLVA
jgi:hypothetical protein